MKIQYIAHSSFFVETDKTQLLFDYEKGQIPDPDPEKPLFVFVSHRHADHFNPVIFELYRRHPDVTYLLSFDLKPTSKKKEKWGAADIPEERMLVMKAHQTRQLPVLGQVETLRSTDEGVAYLITLEGGSDTGEVIYHAGDLNWWLWDGEDKGWLGTMTANYKREIGRIEGRRIDAAFLPLDDRQGQWYACGMEWFLQHCRVKRAFPMHYWEDSGVIRRFMELPFGKNCPTIICDTSAKSIWDTEKA